MEPLSQREQWNQRQVVHHVDLTMTSSGEVVRGSLRVRDTSGSVKKWLLLMGVWGQVRCFNGITGDGDGCSES